MAKLIHRHRLGLHADSKYMVHIIDYFKDDVEETIEKALPFFVKEDYSIKFHGQMYKCNRCIFNPSSDRFSSKVCEFMVRGKTSNQGTLDDFL